VNAGRFGAALARALLAGAVLTAAGAGAQEPPARPDPSLPDLGAPLGKSIGGERRARIEEALRKSDHEQAQALLLQAIEREPPSADLLRLLGGVYFVRGNYLGAAVAFKKAEVLAPLDERSRFTLAMSYVVLGRRDWARPELQKLSESAPRNALYVYWTARFDYDDGQYGAAVKGLLQSIALDGRFVKAHDSLGLSYEALGRNDEAIRSYQEAIRLNREAPSPSPWPPLNLGVLLTRLDRLDEAESLFRECLRAEPRFPQGHYQLGVALEKKGRAAEAVPELEEAARLDASYPEPHYALARIHRKNGDAEKADRALALFQNLKKEKDQAGPGAH
jgi:tetratricopeptide (TPR) repeat protein